MSSWDIVLVTVGTQFLAGRPVWDTVLGTHTKLCAVDFEFADAVCSTSNPVNRISNLRTNDLSVVGRMHDVV